MDQYLDAIQPKGLDQGHRSAIRFYPEATRNDEERPYTQKTNFFKKEEKQLDAAVKAIPQVK